MTGATIHTEDLAERFARELAVYDIYPAKDAEVGAGRRLAAALIGGVIVSETDFRRVHRRSGMGLFLASEEGRLTGILAFVPLSAVGVLAVLSGRFNALSPADRHVARRGGEVRALYGWGVAAATRETARRLIDGARVVGQGPAAHLAYFARPTTPAGDRLMRERLGFVDVPGSTDGLVWGPSFLSRAVAA